MTINLKTIEKNVGIIVNLCKKQDIKVVGVTKVFCGNPEIAKSYIKGGVDYLGDSRIENLEKMKNLEIPKIMLRLPMISEAEKIVEYTDISLNSEIQTIRALSEKAIEKNKIHGIILMFDLGDLREGYYYEDDLFSSIEEIIRLKGLILMGIGTNLTCYGGIIPKKETLAKLNSLKKLIKEKHKIDLQIISGGNSSSLHLLEKNHLEGINNLRLGESLILGRESAYGKQIKATSNDGFKLKVEIIEIKEKPSIPSGISGRDAFGNIPSFVDRGVRKRIICAVGKQDVDFKTLYPIDEKIIILGGSSDHIILDGSDSEVDYKIGDIIEFKMHYVSILRAMTSNYIIKELI